VGVPLGKGGDWTGVSAAITRGETVQVIQTAGFHSVAKPSLRTLFLFQAAESVTPKLKSGLA